MQCFLPSEDETRIDINFADGQDSISVDAVDIDNMILDIRSKNIPEDSSFEAEFVRAFEARYNRRLGLTAANMLCQVKYKIFAQVKKNLFGQAAPSDTSEPEATYPNENSDSCSQ